MPPVNSTSLSVPSRVLVRDPVYQQLNDLLQELIRSGEFKTGQQFLTEREVAERFGVSRVTANKALSHLVVAGLLEFRKGVGTFLREGGLDYDLQSLMSFTQRARSAGKQPATKVLRFEQLKGREVPAAVRDALRLGDSDLVYYFERLRLADDEPVILEQHHLVGRFCPGLTKTQLKGSLYELLTHRYGLAITGADQIIRAVSLSAEEASKLNLTTGSAALLVHALGQTEEPLWLEDTVYRADRYEFHNALGTSKRPQRANLVICKSQPGFRRS